ncbi:helix-turn-helix domain-containing protein [Amycolatopsis rifamycinica]|uniref:HTH cro/C1-type domain-containing protein n=1 Tax=Amycolatopsis rifamycinica TaxID=287986 RepID=A0A066TWC5_9PSEU|nr:helix-turn-helix transcriptional regulator [Amycolatopsis rifamycinica]KDN16283.1 hypothetical protein DV20_42760 [Amycolatopsis rifamycinica]
MTTNDTAAEAASGSADPGAAEAALSHELKRLLGESGRSGRELGDEVNTSASTISRVTNGKHFPSLQLVRDFAEKTGGDPGHLERLWTDADAERRARKEVTPESGSGGGERELLRMTAAALNAERRNKGLSLDKLEKTSGWSKSTLSSVMRGEQVPDMSMLQDVLQAMHLSDAEAGNWTARFARAAERARQVEPTLPAFDIDAELRPLKARLRRHTIGLVVAGVVAVAAVALSGVASWVSGDVYYPSYSTGSTTTVTVGTPQPPGPRTAVVDVGSAAKRASVFAQPRTESNPVSTLEHSTRVVLVCQIATGIDFGDPELDGSRGVTKSKVWVKISLDGKELGYIPTIYLQPDSDQLPVLPPPAC